jgi:hypothetical protein
MRSVPNRPSGVREYRDIGEFLREDAERPAWAGASDKGGLVFGDWWRLEDQVRRWDTTRWRVSWLDDSTREVYAIECVEPRPSARPTTARVWLLGVLGGWCLSCGLGGSVRLSSHA